MSVSLKANILEHPSIHEALTIGVVGAGQIAADTHIPSMLLLAGAKLTWIVDSDDKRARRVAKSFGVPHARMPSDLAELPKADVVLLAVPYGVRAPYYAAFSRSGTAVYVEKPFARTAEQHEKQCALYRPERLGVGFQKRCSAATRTMEDIIETGAFGSLREVSVELGRPGVSTAGRYSADLSLAGGGFLFEVGVHLIDFVLYVSHALDVEVTSGEMLLDRGFDIHTDAIARMTMKGGKRSEFKLLITNLRHTSMEVTFEFDSAIVRVNPFGDRRIRVRARRGTTEYELGGEATEYPLTPPQTFYEHWSLFLDGVRTGRPNLTSASQSRLTTALVEQLYRLAGV